MIADVSWQFSSANPRTARRRRILAALAVAVLGLGALLAYQVGPNRQRMQDDLARRSSRALAAEPNVRVAFDGRDAVIEAPSSEGARRAEAIVAGVSGVRAVRTRVAPPVSHTPAWVSATVGADRRLRLTGEVPTEEDHAALTAAAGAAVVDDVEVTSAVAADTALARFPALLRVVPRVAGIGVHLKDRELTLRGTAADEREHATLAAAARATGASVTDQLAVPALQPQLTALPKVTFETDGARLTDQAQAALRAAAALLAAYPSATLRIEGHTDGLGPAAANLRLSRDRATAVRDFLRGQGVGINRMTTIGYGETRPLVPERSAADRAGNRRVELITNR